MSRKKTYCISFLYARSAYSGMKMESLGIQLHKNMYTSAARGQPMTIKTAKVKITDHPGAWTSVSYTFVCKGGERFITLGSFDKDLVKVEYIPPNQNKKTAKIFNYARSGYYFIEDIKLTELNDGESCTPIALPHDTTPPALEIIEKNIASTDTVFSNPFVLEQLNFETAKSEILSSSFDELDELFSYLLEQPGIRLLVMGHTDDRGDDEQNMKLSEARAQAVSDYLVAKGISPQRITCKGFGETMPVAENVSEEGRLKNRRVEFLFE